MTVVPSDHTMTLICDGCGDTITGTARVLPDAEVVWTLVLEHGWAGSPFASGPHHCPRCDVTAATTGANGAAHGDGRPQHLFGIDDLDELGHDPAVVDADPAEAVRRALRESIEVGRRVLVDLTDVEIINSVGLGVLVRAHQEARERGVTLCLVGPSRFVLTVLHTMRLDGLFPVLESRAIALGGLTTVPTGAPE
ncbi:STAS domain-containing protein [Micromonospora krabiensis]|uniref:Anti-anti-sigma factor n=1 Tax=Micromonospora krabiensis TaxID=307121 RepID=A0A1C3MZF9_9ACTN|nr:STAS domain-containing protein [Micromonospora krabiensis]SBV25701.1 anti-anti-sigma factor [Micromonospora krabiensis]